MGNNQTGPKLCECCGYYAETTLDFIGDVLTSSNTIYPYFSLLHRRHYCRQCANYIVTHHTGSHDLKLQTLYQDCRKEFSP
jgi:hypothetical protein